MKFDPARRHRRSIRLKGYDYTQAGAYFVTVVAKERAHLFGEIVDGKVRLSAAGRIVQQEWQRLEQRFPNIHLGAFVMMIGQLKSRVPKRLWAQPGMQGKAVWQRNYCEHIIRGQAERARLHRYIESNPARQASDREHRKDPKDHAPAV